MYNAGKAVGVCPAAALVTQFTHRPAAALVTQFTRTSNSTGNTVHTDQQQHYAVSTSETIQQHRSWCQPASWCSLWWNVPSVFNAPLSSWQSSLTHNGYWRQWGATQLLTRSLVTVSSSSCSLSTCICVVRSTACTSAYSCCCLSWWLWCYSTNTPCNNSHFTNNTEKIYIVSAHTAMH